MWTTCAPIRDPESPDIRTRATPGHLPRPEKRTEPAPQRRDPSLAGETRPSAPWSRAAWWRDAVPAPAEGARRRRARGTRAPRSRAPAGRRGGPTQEGRRADRPGAGARREGEERATSLEGHKHCQPPRAWWRACSTRASRRRAATTGPRDEGPEEPRPRRAARGPDAGGSPRRPAWRGCPTRGRGTSPSLEGHKHGEERARAWRAKRTGRHPSRGAARFERAVERVLAGAGTT